MAVFILTDYSNLVYNLAKSRGLIPFEKTVREHSWYAPALLLACFLSRGIGKETLGFGVGCGAQEAEFISWIKPVHAPAPHWVGFPASCARWCFGCFLNKHASYLIKIALIMAKRCRCSPVKDGRFCFDLRTVLAMRMPERQGAKIRFSARRQQIKTEVDTRRASSLTGRKRPYPIRRVWQALRGQTLPPGEGIEGVWGTERPPFFWRSQNNIA